MSTLVSVPHIPTQATKLTNFFQLFPGVNRHGEDVDEVIEGQHYFKHLDASYPEMPFGVPKMMVTPEFRNLGYEDMLELVEEMEDLDRLDELEAMVEQDQNRIAENKTAIE